MNKIKFYVCEQCGNLMTATGNATISCCGKTLEPLVAKKAEEMRPIWIENGTSILPVEKHKDWISFVGSVVKNLPFNHMGNPIVEILELLPKVNEMEDDDDIKDVIRNLMESRSMLIRALFVFSNKPEKIARLYDELKRR